MQSVNYAECHKYAHLAKRRYAECHYGECRGARSWSIFLTLGKGCEKVKKNLKLLKGTYLIKFYENKQ
jgi:hypothetical protein